MIDISLYNVSLDYGFGEILDKISLNIKYGEKVALIGDNGVGKSSIFKLITREETPTSGSISIRKNVTIGYLSQDIKLRTEDLKVKDILYQSIEELIHMRDKLKEYEDKMSLATPKNLDKLILKYTTLQDNFISLGGYEIDERVGKIIKGFKLERLLDTKYSNLSGGEKRIVEFATLMIQNPDIMLLDEPTNHLDIKTLEWLENILKNYKGTLLFISHDRYFLDRVSDRIIYLERGKTHEYSGNYSSFLEENENRIMQEFKDYKDQQKLIKAMKESIKKLREFGTLGDDARFFKRANSIEKRLEKLEKIKRPISKKKIPISFNSETRSGKDVLTIKDFDFKFADRTLFNHASMSIKYGDCVCLIGKNGSGKSTLLNTILNGHEQIRLGTNIRIGYIPQEIQFPANKRVYEIAREHYSGEESHLRSALYKFMFDKNSIYKSVSSLSGGEKVRLKLFCLMQSDINFLILDEPTNHIDISTRETLEDALNDFEGTILFVSHDRYFINKIATKIIAIEDEKLLEYPGNYDDYHRHLSN